MGLASCVYHAGWSGQTGSTVAEMEASEEKECGGEESKRRRQEKSIDRGKLVILHILNCFL